MPRLGVVDVTRPVAAAAPQMAPPPLAPAGPGERGAGRDRAQGEVGEGRAGETPGRRHVPDLLRADLEETRAGGGQGEAALEVAPGPPRRPRGPIMTGPGHRRRR